MNEEEERLDGVSEAERLACAVIIEQDKDKEDEIQVTKPDWKRWGLSLQETVNYARYELVEPPEPGKRGKLIIARLKPSK